MKKLVIISALILTIIMGIAFIAGVTAVTDTTSVDPASLSLSLFKKKTDTTPPATITGNAVDDFGNTISTVTVKAEEEVGRVRDDFYGVNNHGIWGSDLSWVDIDNNGALDTLSNYQWHRDALEDANINYLRADMKLNAVSLSEGVFEDNSPNSNYGDINTRKELVTWAKAKDIKILFIASYMPKWLANTTTGWCKWTETNMSCPPSNYTKWGKLVVDFLQEVGCDEDTCEVDVWNEPYHYFWLDNLPYDSQIKANEYIKLYNSTYQAIKSVYPNMPVGGPSGFMIDAPNMMNTFLSNIKTNMDFISFHIYEGDAGFFITQDSLYEQINNLLDDCTTYGANCSRIIISEWNVYDSAIQNDSSRANEYGAQIGYGYISLLNNYPQNITSSFYQWTEDTNYGLTYGQYPYRWSMVSEPQLDNAYYPPYNVTKDFAHYHAGGNMIVNSSSNNNSIKSVASLNPQGVWHITVINTATNNINVNIDVSSTGVEAIKDLATNKVYPVINGIVDVGILTEYDVKHYQGIADYEVEKEVVTSAGGYSVGKNKIVSTDNLNINPNEFTAIETDTSIVISTSEIFVNTNTNTNNKNNEEEKEEVYGPIQSKEDISEIEYKSLTGTLSLAVSNNSYLAILIILLGSIICTAIIISIIYRKKKREADKVKKLMDWVDKARALGYSNDKMKEMLAPYNWDKDLVEKVVGK